LIRSVSRRLERLEARMMATTCGPIVFRILLVHPEEGLTGVLVLDSDGTTKEPGTPEEKERVRADLERRRAARLPWKGGATDTHDYAPA
jgi:hypothetical protein